MHYENLAYDPQDDIPVKEPIIATTVDKPLGKYKRYGQSAAEKRCNTHQQRISTYTPNTQYRLQQILSIKDMLENEQEKGAMLYKNTDVE